MQESTRNTTAATTPNLTPARELDPETYEFAQKIFTLVRSGDTDILGSLLEQGLPSNLCNHRGDSLLMLASYHGHAETARLLLRHGADPEMFNDSGQTPIAGAAFKGEVTMVRLLLDHGARIDGVAPNGKTALMYAAMFDRAEVLELLLERGADPRARDAGGMTSLDAAEAMGARNTARRLAELAH